MDESFLNILEWGSAKLLGSSGLGQIGSGNRARLGCPDHSDLGQNILYAYDDTENVGDIDPDVLEATLQSQADSSIQWVQDNKMLCSSEENKTSGGWH